LSCFSSGIFVVHSYLCMFQYVYSAMYFCIVSILACTQPVRFNMYTVHYVAMKKL